MNTRAQAAEARPGFGSTHLHQETFMRSSDTERTTALLDDLAAGDLGLFVTADTPAARRKRTTRSTY